MGLSESKAKRATVVIPRINLSGYEVKLKRDNEALIKRLDQLIERRFGFKRNEERT